MIDKKYIELRQSMEYEYMIPPVKNYDFFEFTKEDAKIYFNWYMEEKGHRIEMLEEYVHNAGVDIDFDYSPESLIPLWRWYETIIVSEKKTEEETKPKNYINVNRPVVSGFKAGKDLNPSRTVYVLTLKSEEEKNEKRLYNSYYVWQQYIE